jgi:hypothetical protein
MMDDNTIEKCVAMLAIAAMATFGPKFGMTDTMFGMAATGIAGMAGTGAVSSLFNKQIKNKEV